MLSANVRCELCWFAATCLGVGAYAFILFALAFTASDPMSEPRVLLILLAGVALALMAILMIVAVRMDRRSSR
jgi:hypothetical protein